MEQREYVGRDLEVMDHAEGYHHWILEEFRPFLGARVAEVGAGSGAFSQLLLGESRVRQLTAVEPSARMHARLTRHVASDPRATTYCGIFADIAREQRNSFDTIVYVNVLEHIENDYEELRYAADALVPGGHLCIFVPALRYLYSEFDASIGHYRRYHKPEMLRLLRGVGLEPTHARYFDVFGVIPWLVMYRVLGFGPAASQVRAYDKLIVPVMKRVERTLPPPVGKNVLAVARKPLRS